MLKANYHNRKFCFLAFVLFTVFVYQNTFILPQPTKQLKQNSNVQQYDYEENPPLVENPSTHINKNIPQAMVEKTILEKCNQICNDSIQGTPSLFFDYIQKEYNCHDLWSISELDDSRNGLAIPYEQIDASVKEDFSFHGKVSFFSGRFFDQKYLGNDALQPVWSKELIEEWKLSCSIGNLQGNYGVSETKFLVQGLMYVSKLIQTPNIIVIGSEIPWVEACILSVMPHANITTLEFGKIQSKHPQVHTIIPSELKQHIQTYYNYFDAVVSFSSIEHTGLGRYGDLLNPWGDRQMIARSLCITKQNGYLVLGVPYGEDSIEYNAHRTYGRIMYPHLVANWHQIWRAEGGDQRVHVFQK